MNGAECVSARSSVISKLQRFQRLADGLGWILSPLRLPVPPSRHFVEVLEFTAVYLLHHLGAKNDKCETVQESVEVLEDLHRSSSYRQ